MHIRKEQASDKSAIEALIYQAFENHPHHAPGAKPTEHIIVNKLRDAEMLSVSLVAEKEADIVGHIAFSPITINNKTGPWFGLAPVSVMPKYQNKGVGRQLIEAGLTQLKARGAEVIVLLGEPEYYGRFGFKMHENLVLPGVPSEYFLALALNNESATLPQGTVKYHSSFD